MSKDTSLEAAGVNDRMRLAVLDNLSDGVYFVDRQRRITFWNKGAERLTGFSAEEVIGRRCKDGILNHCDAAGTIMCGKNCPLLGTIKDGQAREAHVFLHHKSGHRAPVRVRAVALRDDSDRIIGAVEIFNDDSTLLDSGRRADELQRSAMTDALTGVGNRRLAEMTLAGWLEQHHRFDWPFGVVFADIDHFKTRQRLLRPRRRRRSATHRRPHPQPRQPPRRRSRSPGRRGVRHPRRRRQRQRPEHLRRTTAHARRAIQTLRPPPTHPLTISIGATLVAPGDDADGILRCADALLYAAKAAGRNRVALDSNFD